MFGENVFNRLNQIQFQFSDLDLRLWLNRRCLNVNASIKKSLSKSCWILENTKLLDLEALATESIFASIKVRGSRINHGDPNLKVPATHIAGNSDTPFLNQIKLTLKTELDNGFKFVLDVVVVDVNRGNALIDTNRVVLAHSHFFWLALRIYWSQCPKEKNNDEQLRKHLDYQFNNNNWAG